MSNHDYCDFYCSFTVNQAALPHFNQKLAEQKFVLTFENEEMKK